LRLLLLLLLLLLLRIQLWVQLFRNDLCGGMLREVG
jgi:hypothetical protein